MRDFNNSRNFHRMVILPQKVKEPIGDFNHLRYFHRSVIVTRPLIGSEWRQLSAGVCTLDCAVPISWQQPNSLKIWTIICSNGFWGTRTTFCMLCSLTGDAVWNTNLDLVVMIENWYPKSTPWPRVTFSLDNCIKGPYKIRIGAHRHIRAYRGACWLSTLHHMAADDGRNIAE